MRGEKIFDSNVIITKFDYSKIRKGLIEYKAIMDFVASGNSIISDSQFQKIFASFYKMNLRRPTSEWKKKYFALMNELRFKDSSFKDVLTRVCEFSEDVEVSFASKLLATINDKCPIWDSKVLKALGIRVYFPYKYDKCLRVYDEICEWYDEFLKSDIGKEYLELFDKTFPNYTNISDVKKIDFLMWGVDKYAI